MFACSFLHACEKYRYCFGYCVNSFAVLVFRYSGGVLGLGYVWAAEIRNIYFLFVLLYLTPVIAIYECDSPALPEFQSINKEQGNAYKKRQIADLFSCN
jgi:hypothetical protein